MTGRFLVGGEVSMTKKRSLSILKVRGTHSSPKMDEWVTRGG
jgi:hypothetical protein